jgi:hypothetical protein
MLYNGVPINELENIEYLYETDVDTILCTHNSVFMYESIYGNPEPSILLFKYKTGEIPTAYTIVMVYPRFLDIKDSSIGITTSEIIENTRVSLKSLFDAKDIIRFTNKFYIEYDSTAVIDSETIDSININLIHNNQSTVILNHGII